MTGCRLRFGRPWSEGPVGGETPTRFSHPHVVASSVCRARGSFPDRRRFYRDVRGQPALRPGERRVEIDAGSDPVPLRVERTAPVFTLKAPRGKRRDASRGSDTVRGLPAWKAMFIIDGGIPGAHLHDTTVSWFDSSRSARCASCASTGYRANRDTHIFPDDKTYRTRTARSTLRRQSARRHVVVYLVRTLPLGPGRCYVLSRYFKPRATRSSCTSSVETQWRSPPGASAILLRPEIKTTASSRRTATPSSGSRTIRRAPCCN